MYAILSSVVCLHLLGQNRAQNANLSALRGDIWNVGIKCKGITRPLVRSRVESSRVESSRSDKKQTKYRSLELESHPLNHGVRKITKEQDNRIDIQGTY